MIAASSGIGFLVLNAQNLMETTKLMVGIVLLSLLGLASHWLLTPARARGDPLEGRRVSARAASDATRAMIAGFLGRCGCGVG